MTVAASCPPPTKNIHRNGNVYLPRIREPRKRLGWVEGQLVPESLKAVESWEAEDENEQICWNKYSAAASGTQQPVDLASFFLDPQVQLDCQPARRTHKNQFADGPEGLQKFRDHRWKAFGEENSDLPSIFLCGPFLNS